MDKKIRNSAELFAGIIGAYPRSMFKSVGYHRDELKKPVIGVVSSLSEMHPGSYPNKELAQFVKAWIWAAGGTPVEFLLLPPKEIAARLKAVPQRPAPGDRGFLGLYCRHVAQADKGAVLGGR